MKLSKKIMVAAAAGALGVAAATPAMAFENEFHGMYRAYGIMSNAYSGSIGFNLAKDSAVDKYIEQRARVQYIAKASDSLKLVTHFELDTKFGSSTNGKYANGGANGSDAGNLDADRVTLETKQVYLDFKIPSTPVNVKVGIQPWGDSMNFIYGLFDATGVTATAKFGALTTQYGYFTVGTTGTGTAFDSNAGTQDLNVLELKYDINKNLQVGTSYYLLLDKAANGATYGNNTVGLNATGKFGPATVTANLGMQFGKEQSSLAISTTGTTAFAASLAAKVAAGPGTINAAALYLSGDDNNTGYNRAWQPLSGAVNFYAPANTYLLIRNLDTINTSSSISNGLNYLVANRGIMGLFAGYSGDAGKMFYSGNVAAAKVAAKRAADSANMGMELNASVGYKMYSNMSVALTGAYAFLGGGFDSTGARVGGAADADNPFMLRAALNYAF